MGQRVRGFTLIEVLLTLAIVAILSSIAIPSYNVFLTRAQLMEAVSLSQEIRVALVETHIDRGRFLDANHGDLDQRNAIAGLGSIDSYRTGVVNEMWIGLDGGDPNVAHIVVDLDDSLAHVGIDANPGVRSRVTYNPATGSYTFECNVAWASGIRGEYLSTGC
ncbi:MAG: prepilin-type N-terminal cleavage/methylation domain-containing protein [Pseudomonadota bacterium]